MSAFGGKADIEWHREESPLLTHSGHLPALRKARHCAARSVASCAFCIWSRLVRFTGSTRRGSTSAKARIVGIVIDALPSARIFRRRRTNVRALSRACFSILRQGSHEFSYEWLHEERAAWRRNVHLRAKRLKL
jgi:hypothetical protein